MDLEQKARHNALLKQLLSKEQAFRGEGQPPSTPDVSFCPIVIDVVCVCHSRCSVCVTEVAVKCT